MHDEYFIGSLVITVKLDKFIEIAHDSKKLNDSFHKIKYQMQSIDHLMDTIACKISEHKQKAGILYFSKTEPKNAYSKIPLHADKKNIVISIYLAETLQENTVSKTVFMD